MEAAKSPELQDVEFSGLTQSAIARLEAGANPKPETLRALSVIYGLSYETVIAAYTGSVFFGVAPEEALLTGGLLNPSTPFFVTNAGRVLSLSALAEWEKGIVDKSRKQSNASLWIVAPNFVDDTNNEFLETVVDHLIACKANITYFISERDVGEGRRFDIFLERVAWRLKREHPDKVANDELGNISVYVLSQDEQLWLTSDMVISNPHDVVTGVDKPEGFTVVSLEGKPAFAVPMPETQVRGIILLIRAKIRRKIENPDGSWISCALRRSDSYKRIKEL